MEILFTCQDRRRHSIKPLSVTNATNLIIPWRAKVFLVLSFLHWNLPVQKLRTSFCSLYSCQPQEDSIEVGRFTRLGTTKSTLPKIEVPRFNDKHSDNKETRLSWSYESSSPYCSVFMIFLKPWLQKDGRGCNLKYLRAMCLFLCASTQQIFTFYLPLTAILLPFFIFQISTLILYIVSIISLYYLSNLFITFQFNICSVRLIFFFVFDTFKANWVHVCEIIG